MRKAAFILASLCVACAAFAQTSAPKSTDEILSAFRNDLQAERSDIMAKNLTLTADQAAKFWPMFSAYQKEQNAIIDEQLKLVQQYIAGYDKLDDASALALMQAHLDRDAKMLALRKKWLPEFQKALPGKLAVRAMQIDRRLSLAQQFEIASHIPLAR